MMITVNQEHAAARLAIEHWQGHQPQEPAPYRQFDKECDLCPYTCRLRWRFAGMTGKSGRVYEVGPNCPVLWRFSPFNPLAWLVIINWPVFKQ